MTQPSIKKNADGTWRVVGVEEKYTTQAQADYEEMIKAAQMIPGAAGEQARIMLDTNPSLSPGALSALVKIGALPDNDLTKQLVEIDKLTEAKRKQDAFLEAQRIANEKFSNTNRGKLWTAIKGATRTLFIAGESIFELGGAAIRYARKSIDLAAKGEINWFTGNPTDPTKTREELGMPTGILQAGSFKESTAPRMLYETKVGQAVKAMIEGKEIDFGQGFFASEETGLGFAARQAKNDAYKVTVKLDNGRTYERPYSWADPVIEIIPGIEPDTGVGSVLSAIGDLGAFIVTEPGIAFSRLKATRDAIARTARVSKGMDDAIKLSSLDAKLEQAVKETNEAIEAWKTSTGFTKFAKEEEIAEGLKKQMQYADDYDRIVANPEAIANFLSGKNGIPIINALADMDFKQIYAIGKKGGRRGGFNVAQAKELADAKTREEVLGVLAKYINDGSVAADVLETGTVVGNAIRGIASSRIIAGTTTKIANPIKGLSARTAARMPWVLKVATVLSRANNAVVTNFERLNNTVIENGRIIHASDKDAAIEAIYNYGRATKLDEAVIDDLVDTVLNADSAARVGYAATGKLFDAIFKQNALLRGVDKEALDEVTTLFQNGRDELASYWATRHANNAKLDYVFAGGKGGKITISGPHLDSEMLNSMVYLPPVQEVLDIINVAARIPKIGKGVEATKEVASFITNNVWKRMVLIRPAYIVRNIAEEQIRVLGTGHVSFFNNPLTAIAMWLGRTESTKVWRRVLGQMDPYRNTIMGTGFKLGNAADEFAYEAAAHDAVDAYLGWLTSKSVSSMDYSDITTISRINGVIPVGSGHSRWWEGLASEIRKLHSSIAGRTVARTAPGFEQGGVDFVLRGAGRADWEEFAKAHNPEVRDWLLSDEGAMLYLFTGKNPEGRLVSVRARIDEAAGSGGEASQLIKNLIAYGRINIADKTMIIPKGIQSAENSIKNAAEIAKKKKPLKDANQLFADELKAAFDGKGDWENITMAVPLAEFKKRKKEVGRVKQVSDWFFDVAVKFETQSTMGPEWRQKYWDAINDIAGALDSNAVVKLREVAKDSLTPLQSWKGDAIGKNHPVWKALEKTGKGGDMTVEMAHQYASNVASRHVQDLFYDASRRRLLFHQLRLVLPFGQAWEDTIKAWGKIALNNPMQVYKVSKGLQWLTKPESSALYQLSDAKDYYDPNQGFFYTDPLDGQRKFFLPFMATGLNFLSSFLPGGAPASTRGPMAVSATPQSLNFAFASGSIIPGVGPGLTFSVAALDNSGLNPLNMVPTGLREWAYTILYPFGMPDMKQGFIEGLLPNNWRRMLAPFGQIDAGYAGAYGPVMNYLASGGGYNLDDRADQQRLLEDTDRFAKWFTFWRGVIGTASPFAPLLQGITTLDDGNVVLNTALWNDFKELEVAAGGDKTKAYKDFMDLYGPDKLFAIINESTGAPSNLMTYELIKRDPDVVDLYPDVYGYAYPGGGYSQQLYRWQRRMGNKTPLSKEDLLNRATYLRYSAAKDTLLSRSTAEGWSSDQFGEASRNLRKYFAAADLTLKSDVYRNDRIKQQLMDMALDDRFDDSEAVQGLRDYLYLRQQALDAAGIDTDNLARKKAYPQRVWLAQQAVEIIKRYPEFQNMFYTFFKKELEGN